MQSNLEHCQGRHVPCAMCSESPAAFETVHLAVPEFTEKSAPVQFQVTTLAVHSIDITTHLQRSLCCPDIEVWPGTVQDMSPDDHGGHNLLENIRPDRPTGKGA
jgi:hypothetical protein